MALVMFRIKTFHVSNFSDVKIESSLLSDMILNRISLPFGLLARQISHWALGNSSRKENNRSIMINNENNCKLQSL